ncbi:MAG: peptidoglycan-associated lipoprotein Pal [Magnetococcales bacterium]|nr:peptidoglycan-associated lipoprotein Pal [Magnetococcales bacterium]
MKKQILMTMAAMALTILTGCSSTDDANKKIDGGGDPGSMGLNGGMGGGGQGQGGFAPGGSLSGGGVMDPSANENQRVYFDYDSSIVRDDARPKLMSLARMVNKGQGVVIEGHCDERGTREYNLALGQKRADAVKDFLVSQGVSAGQIQTISFGKERPLAVGHEDGSWAQNRRAEVLSR